jgi:hypothetical protein
MSERMRDTRRAEARQGRHVGPVPVGYIRGADGQLLPSPHEPDREAVKMGYQLYATGNESTRTVTIKLNEAGYSWPRPDGGAYEELIAQLRYHQPRAIILDDAHQIFYTARRAALATHIGVMRDMAAATGIKHILVGTYELLALTTVDAQASRMSHVVHFPRYRYDLPRDVQVFQCCAPLPPTTSPV